jgi:hypothetical protein
MTRGREQTMTHRIRIAALLAALALALAGAGIA